MDKLLDELERERANIKTDQYSMSIGEIINLYKEGDIKLNPAFQRLFRWSDEQKTRFIESVLLGIPIPEIFVAQLSDGKWVVVDGVQRISTILQLMGLLKDKPPLKMTWAKYLPSLEDETWDSIPVDVQRLFKRGKLGINIILTENEIHAQYELFQRLNTGGLHLEDQEIRNCLIVMVEPSFYEKINILKEYPSFKKTIKLSDRKIVEEYHMELILRYFIGKHFDLSSINISKTHLNNFLDDYTIKLINEKSFDLDKEISLFKEFFDWIHDTLGDLAFQKYNLAKDKFEGGFSNAAFELVSTGIALNLEKVKILSKDSLTQKLKELYRDERVIENTKHGAKALLRFKTITEISKNFFSNEI